MRFTRKFRVFRRIPVWLVEQPETEFHAQYPAYSIINAAHRNFTFLHKFFQIITETPFIRHHRHIDTGINSHFHGFFLRSGHFVTGIQIVYIRPIRYDEPVPIEVLLQPFRQKFVIGVKRKPVVHSRIHHNRQSTGFHRFQKRGKMLFTHILHCNRRWRTIFAGYGDTIPHIMFQTGSYPIGAYMIRILALKTNHRFTAHLCIDVAVFSIIFPHTRPTGITAKIHNGRVRPRNASGFCFVSRYLGSFPYQFTIECSPHIDTLRKESSAGRIGGAMYLIDAIHTGNSHRPYRFFLNSFD